MITYSKNIELILSQSQIYDCKGHVLQKQILFNENKIVILFLIIVLERMLENKFKIHLLEKQLQKIYILWITRLLDPLLPSYNSTY